VKREQLGSPSEFAALLAPHLASFADATRPLPSEADLARLVEVMFYASLHEDEARRTNFNVAWAPGALDSAAALVLASPVVVSPSNLAKLAPAALQEATSIAVRREGERIVAWALLQRHAVAESPLTIRSLAPGVLRVDDRGVPRALYARGEASLLGGAHEVKSPAKRLTAAFPRWAADADPDVGIDLRAAAVTRIAVRALDHGHGGMILVIPAEVAEPVGLHAHYAVARGADVLARRHADLTRGVALKDRLARLRESRPRSIDGHVNVRDEAQIEFAEAIELVARLTAIDNAVLIDTDLQIRGFGVQVMVAEAGAAPFAHVSPYTSEVHVDTLSTYKGTRHPAGVIFCMRQRSEAAAIIASQDGRLSLATKDAKGVEVLGSYERAFGWR
jgi:hypothetical protein